MSRSIKFSHGTEGKVNFHSEGMGLTSLLSLGALEHTAKRSPDGVMRYGTDKEGLTEAIYQSEQVVGQLNACISSVSILAANANLQEVPGNMQDVFYLLHGLSTLADTVSTIRSDMAYAIEKQA